MKLFFENGGLFQFFQGLDAYPGQVDGPRGDVDVHQVVNDAALDVALVPVDDDLVPGVDDPSAVSSFFSIV